MEVQAIIEDSDKFCEKYVKNVLNDTETARIRSSEYGSELLSRLFPCIPTNISEITDHLILTSASNVNPQNLDTCNISCIISCAPELPDPPHGDQVIYYKISVLDSGCSRLFSYFDKAADLIQQISNLGGRTLIYCVAGVSRSVSICIAYLMKYHRLSLLDSYNYVKLRRPRIKPNCGFFKQLIEYEKQLVGCNTVQMVFNDFVQLEIPDVYDEDYRPVIKFSKKRKSRQY